MIVSTAIRKIATPVFFFVALAYSEISPLEAQEETNGLTSEEFVIRFSQEIRSACWNKRDKIITFEERNVLCHHGEIKKLEDEDYLHRKYSIAYINSPGGDISHAMTLGRELFRNGTYAVIDQHCHSACGSYLLAGPKRILVTEGTVMSMHTATPRTPIDFVFMKYPTQVREAVDAARSRTSDQGTKDLISFFFEYDEFYEEFVLREMNFFKVISRDVAYTQRYREVVRTLSRRKNDLCKPKSRVTLIIGPEYLNEFKIKTIKAWFPSNREDFLELIPNTAKTDALVFDFDDHPFWLPDEGLLSPSDCWDDVEKINDN